MPLHIHKGKIAERMCCVKKQNITLLFLFLLFLFFLNRLRVSSYLPIFSDAVMGWTDGKTKKKTKTKSLSCQQWTKSASCLPLFSGQTLWTGPSVGHSVQDKRGNGALWSHQSKEKSGGTGKFYFSLTFKIQALMLSRWWKKWSFLHSLQRLFTNTRS